LNMSGIGLDIGSRKIKIVKLRKNKSQLEILSFGSRETPRGSLEGGSVLDPYVLGDVIAELVQELGLKERKVNSAVAGSQVYTRIITMPRLSLPELRQAVRYEAANFLPVPPEQVAMDVFPIREFQDREGQRTELFFVAVRRTQVERIQTACRLGKLKLQTLEIESLALNRLFAWEDASTRAFLNLGALRPYFSVYREGVPVFNRNLSFAYSGYQPGAALPCPAEYAQFPFRSTDRAINDIVREVARSCEYYRLQYGNDPGKILITGGGARIPGLERALAEGLGCEAEVGDWLSRARILQPLQEAESNELRYDFAVAVGLGLRGVRSWGTIRK